MKTERIAYLSIEQLDDEAVNAEIDRLYQEGWRILQVSILPNRHIHFIREEDVAERIDLASLPLLDVPTDVPGAGVGADVGNGNPVDPEVAALMGTIIASDEHEPEEHLAPGQAGA